MFAGRAFRNPRKEIVGYRHHSVLIRVVGTGLSLAFDLEPYGPRDREYRAGQRLLRRAVAHPGPRFGDYVVVDGEFPTAPFPHTADEAGLKIIARRLGTLFRPFARIAYLRLPCSARLLAEGSD